MSKLNKLFLTAETSIKLGLRNVLYVAYYRFSLKSGRRKKRFSIEQAIEGEFFTESKERRKGVEQFLNFSTESASEIMNGLFTYYHYHKFDLGQMPEWFTDPFSNKKLKEEVTNKHWTDIDEFDLNTGDIKNIWELSRFDWVTDLARGYASFHDKKFLLRLNELLNDWAEHNPTNRGINWRCGQETSIRVMKLYNASVILGNSENITSVLFSFVLSHLDRINGNIRYAIAQDNNHGTSEAAGLYVGAIWLLNQSETLGTEVTQRLKRYKKRGRKILEERIDKLILTDGTFAQKSVNYHRVVMDTFSVVLDVIKRYNEPSFNNRIVNKLKALGEWLLQMISNDKGEVANIGANDGALFENLHSCDYRDFRPSVQLFFALLNNELVWDDNKLNESLYWRGINFTELNQKKDIELKSGVKDKEFVQLVYNDTVVRVIATQDNFRPGNDVLHTDVWHKGVNIVMDSGSFSYNDPTSNYYKSIASHNSLQFGDYEPMPKIGRFLNGKWVRVESDTIIDNEQQVSWKGSYKDYRGNKHKRTVLISKTEGVIYITDSFISKVGDEAVALRFNLSEDFEKYASISCKDKEGNELGSEVNEAYHSLYYMQRDTHNQLLYTQKRKKGEFRTTIKLK